MEKIELWFGQYTDNVLQQISKYLFVQEKPFIFALYAYYNKHYHHSTQTLLSLISFEQHILQFYS